MEKIYKNVPCRESQLNDLFELLGDGDGPVPCSIFISGNMATGKSLCVDRVLNYLHIKHVVINCIECYSPKIMYESILGGLHDKETDLKCDSIVDFINSVNRLENKTLVIVLDKAERLRSMDHSLMLTFLRLKELCTKNICTIFISHLIFESFHFKEGARVPIRLYFQNYNKEELSMIIFQYQKSFIEHLLATNHVDDDIKNQLENPELFANFLNAFLGVFYRPCRDLIELQHMARINFIKYCEPLISNRIHSNNLPNLWRHIAPILKSNLELLYLRTFDSQPIITLSPGKENTNSRINQVDLENNLKKELASTKTFAQSLELPYYAKYLLIAAYLASYNPPKEDKRLFMKNHGKQRKRLQNVRAKAKINEKLNTQLGPKTFTLDRLLAIFYAILEEKSGLTSNLLAQIATLVELKLIAGDKEIDLECAKYKCIVGYDFIVAVSQTVGFNIRKYLYDFI